MSNCVQFGKPIFLRHTEVDARALASLLDETHFDKAPHWEPDEPEATSRARCAWWYLQGAVYFEPNGVYISLGNGRSSHTWRDFKWLLSTLAPFMLREKAIVLTMRDESDGFRQSFKQRIVLGRPAGGL